MTLVSGQPLLPGATGFLSLTMAAFFRWAAFGAGVACLLAALSLSDRALAQSFEQPVSPSDFGGVGLLQTRTARFGPDGQFNFGASRIEPYDRVYLNLHFLPWLEATFRYTSMTNRPFRLGGEEGTFLDRGGDVKLKVLGERRYLPALALGLQDTIGTGQFASEYLVASKRYGDLDFSLGLAWGYLAGSKGQFKNPLIAVSDSFRDRTRPGGQGGQFRFGSLFSGQRVSFFGGVEYHTPIRGLSLKLEYDPNDYEREPRRQRLDQSLPLNFGLNYRPVSWAEVSLGLERGNTLMVRLSLRSELHRPGAAKFDRPPPRLRPRPASPIGQAGPGSGARPVDKERDGAMAAQGTLEHPPSTDANDLAARLNGWLEGTGLVVQSVDLGKRAAIIRVVQMFTGDARPAVDRAAPVIAAALPQETEIFTFVVRQPDARGTRLNLTRREIEHRFIANSPFEGLKAEGFALLSLELAKGRATAHLSTQSARPERSYRRAARIVAEHMPAPVGEVTVVGLRDGIEEARLTLRPRQPAPTGRAPSGGTTADGRPGDAASGASDGPGNGNSTKDLFNELEAQGFIVHALHLTETRATVFLTPRRFRQAARNVGRAARVVANHAPAGVEEISVVTMIGNIENNRVTILRQDLEKAVAFQGSPEEIWANATIDGGPGGVPEDAVRKPRDYPSFHWSLKPALRQHVGAPENPYLFQIWGRLAAGLELAPGLSIRGVVGKDIYNNFDKIQRGPKGTLPHVRSDVKRYLQEGEDNLVRLQADYIFSPTNNWYARLSAGLFEQMFGGVGGEVLYRRLRSRLAVGADLNWVRQRDFDQRFSFRDYSVATGHLSIYYDMPFYDLFATIHVGRYLAGDRGATFLFSRQFDSGVTVGAFFTLTNVSAREFGEGSFDKGFFFSLPYDLLLPKSTRSRGSLGFRPLTSDGGQMLAIGPRLYGVTGERNLGYIARDWSTLLD